MEFIMCETRGAISELEDYVRRTTQLRASVGRYGTGFGEWGCNWSEVITIGSFRRIQQPQ